MKVTLLITSVALHVFGFNAFIIPDELPSILSVIYSNIPTLKKGTDSRIGWGFRLGDRADFQFMVELGPQTNTQPLANQGGDNTNKRNTLNNLANTLYAQRQHEKKIQQQKDEETPASETGSWLQTWSKTVSSKEQTPTSSSLPLNAKPGLGIGEIDAKSVIPDDPILEEMEKVKTNKPKKLANKTAHKKAINQNKSLLSILTGNNQSAPATEETSLDGDKPLDDVSLE